MEHLKISDRRIHVLSLAVAVVRRMYQLSSMDSPGSGGTQTCDLAEPITAPMDT